MPHEEINFSDVQRRRSRRRRLVRASLLVGALYVVGLGAAWVIFWSPLFHLQPFDTFLIDGNEKVSDEQILELLTSSFRERGLWRQFFSARNILGWPDIDVHDPKLQPALTRFEVQKDYVRRVLRIEVHERQPYGIWCVGRRAGGEDVPVGQSPSCYWFDDGGVLFERAVVAEGNLLTVVNDYSGARVGLGSRVLPHEFIPNLFSVLRVLNESGLSIREVRIQDLELQEIEVKTHDGPELYFSLRFPAESTRAVIEKLISSGEISRLKYIDLRVQNRAYYQ